MTNPATGDGARRRVSYGEPVRRDGWLDAAAIDALLRQRFPEGLGELEARGDDSTLWLEAGILVDVCRFLKTDARLAFDFLMCLTGIDYQDELGVVYHLFSYSHRHRFGLKVAAPYTKPLLPSLSDIWKAAVWQEREAFDLLGIVFDAHPDLRRLLLPDDWVGHPLRKDYEEQSQYHGIPTTRPNPLLILAESSRREQAVWRGEKVAAHRAKEAADAAVAEEPSSRDGGVR